MAGRGQDVFARFEMHQDVRDLFQGPSLLLLRGVAVQGQRLGQLGLQPGIDQGGQARHRQRCVQAFLQLRNRLGHAYRFYRHARQVFLLGGTSNGDLRMAPVRYLVLQIAQQAKSFHTGKCIGEFMFKILQLRIGSEPGFEAFQRIQRRCRCCQGLSIVRLPRGDGTCFGRVHRPCFGLGHRFELLPRLSELIRRLRIQHARHLPLQARHVFPQTVEDRSGRHTRLSNARSFASRVLTGSTFVNETRVTISRAGICESR